MNKSDDNYVYLINKIDGFIRKYYLNKVVKGSIFLASSFLFAYLVIIFAEYWGHFDPAVRSVLFYTFVLGNSFVLAAYIIHPLLAYFKLGNTISYEQASSIIGRHFIPVKDKLLNTLQLKMHNSLFLFPKNFETFTRMLGTKKGKFMKIALMVNEDMKKCKGFLK
jgi:hypothetical protein